MELGEADSRGGREQKRHKLTTTKRRVVLFSTLSPEMLVRRLLCCSPFFLFPFPSNPCVLSSFHIQTDPFHHFLFSNPSLTHCIAAVELFNILQRCVVLILKWINYMMLKSGNFEHNGCRGYDDWMRDSDKNSCLQNI